MSELKRCPICNEEVKLMFLNQKTYEDAVWDESIGNVPTWFKCYGCDSEFFHDEPIDIPEKQIKWWNTRKPMQNIVERLENEGQKMSEAKSMVKYGKASPSSHRYYKAVSVKKAIEIVKEEGGMNE